MADKVIKLAPPLAKSPPKPDADVLALCKELLRKAEAGEILGVACALDLAEGCTATALAFSEDVRGTALLGSVCLLRVKLEDALIASQEE